MHLKSTLLAICRALLHRFTVKPSSAPAFNTLLPIRYSSILSQSPNYLNTLCSTLFTNYRHIPALSQTSSFLTLSIRDTPTKLPTYFISRTFSFLLSPLLMPHASALYNAVGTITPSFRHFFSFIPNALLLSIFFCVPYTLYPHSFIVQHPFYILYPLPLATPCKAIHFL